MSTTYRVAVLGFSDFERTTLASCFRLSTPRDPEYTLSTLLDDGDFVLADADHAPSVQLVAATERLPQTVFVGRRPPLDAGVWVPRPLDPLLVMRALDALALLVVGGEPGRAPATPLEPRMQMPPSAPPAAAAPAAPAPPAAAAPAAAAPPSAPPRALLVDASKAALAELTSHLQTWGLVVDGVVNSSLAIERLAQRSYDFVFLDLELGADSDLDGLALCQHVKRDHPLPGSVVVIVSARDSELDRVRAALAGCDAYLCKPLHDLALERLLLRHGLKAPPPAAVAVSSALPV